MNTREVIEVLARRVPAHTTFVSSLGRTASELFESFPDQTLFLDSMGDVGSVACGIALGSRQKSPVVAFDTDGSHLMGISLLPCLMGLVPELSNLVLIVLDNGIYESAGCIPTVPASVDWSALGSAFGLKICVSSSVDELERSLDSALKEFCYIVAKVVNAEPSEPSQKNIDGIESRYRLIRHLERTLGRQILAPSVKD